MLYSSGCTGALYGRGCPQRNCFAAVVARRPSTVVGLLCGSSRAAAIYDGASILKGLALRQPPHCRCLTQCSCVHPERTCFRTAATTTVQPRRCRGNLLYRTLLVGLVFCSVAEPFSRELYGSCHSTALYFSAAVPLPRKLALQQWPHCFATEHLSQQNSSV